MVDNNAPVVVQCNKAEIVAPLSRVEWVDFLRVVRRTLIVFCGGIKELQRWIERRYPETIS